MPVWRELGQDPELAFVWARYERRQVELLADYVADEYRLDRAIDYRPELVAGLMLAASWASHRRAAASGGALGLEKETANAVAVAIRMGRAALDTTAD